MRDGELALTGEKFAKVSIRILYDIQLGFAQ